jgi:hypothetical protein
VIFCRNDSVARGDSQGGGDHAALAEDWLEGKTHARTGEPLAIRSIDLPPGSMVSFVHHMLHYVGPRDPGPAPRWGLLLAYRCGSVPSEGSHMYGRNVT